MIAISPKEVREYILENERGSESPTIFKLRPLSLRETIEIEDLIGNSLEASGYPVGTFNYRVIRYGLCGWSNLKDQEGQEVPFITDPNGRVSDKSLERLPTAVRTELANAIWTMSNIDSREAKN